MIERVGSCRVLGEIGSGGMAVVYEAIQEPLRRRVAIKALKPAIAADSQFAQRFEREAEFMAGMQHENILHVIDFIKDERGMFIVMEYVDGIDLYDLLEETPKLHPDIAAIITLQLARALEYAHFRGIVHRDIKPANIMISHQGSVKLMDFGIAKHEQFSDLTEAGTGVGTPSYMSPEQVLGDKLDFRSDLFSVGIVLYQMLTGRKPFVEDDTRSVMQKIRLDEYTQPRKLGVTVPRQLERIISRCMEKQPANRYPSTKALIDDLTEFIAPRVAMSYNARLVLFQQELGVITKEQAQEVLAGVASRVFRRTQRDPRFLRRVAKTQAAVLVAMCVCGLTVQAVSGGFSRAAAPAAALAMPKDAGHLRVVVDPWADVYIDGEYAFTTPSAKRIPLSRGKHYLKFVNPYFETQEQEIQVSTNETTMVSAKLVLRQADKEGSGR